MMQDHVGETDHCTISVKACQGIPFRDVPNTIPLEQIDVA